MYKRFKSLRPSVHYLQQPKHKHYIPTAYCNPQIYFNKTYSCYRNRSVLHTLDMTKLITVFGATGNQGGSVIAQLLNDPKITEEFKIRGITRDTSKSAAQELAQRGVEVVAVSETISSRLRSIPPLLLLLVVLIFRERPI
jgi:hypothetical protein